MIKAPFGWCHAIAHAAEASLPISARDLAAELSGPALGLALRRAEDAFIASGFSMSRDELRVVALERPGVLKG